MLSSPHCRRGGWSVASWPPWHLPTPEPRRCKPSRSKPGQWPQWRDDTGGGGNEALSLLTVKAWRHSSCHDHLPVPSVPWRSGRGAALSPEQVEDGVSQGIPSTCSATIWPLKQTSACKTIQLQVIKRINLVMLQSEGEHVIHYSSIRGLIRTWLIRVHHCLKLSTKKMF